MKKISKKKLFLILGIGSLLGSSVITLSCLLSRRHERSIGDMFLDIMKDIDSDFVKYHTEGSLGEQLKKILDEYEEHGYFKDRMKEALIKTDKRWIKKAWTEVKSFFMFVYSRYDHTPKRANVNIELDKKLWRKIYKFAYWIEPYRTELSRARDMNFVVSKFLTLYSNDEKKELLGIFDKLINSTTFKDAYNHTKAIFRIWWDELWGYVYYCDIFLPDK